MPFINEVLEANEAQIKQAREAKSVATTSRFLFDPDQVFEKPAWLGAEVTGDKKYYNASLSQFPFKDWGE